MKNLARLSVTLFLSLLLTSCVDYVQSVTYKNGMYRMYYKITLSKLLFALADENPEEVFGQTDDFDLETLPPNASVKKVSTDLEVGAEIAFSVSPRTTDENEKAFLPRVSGNKCYFPFLLGQNGSVLDSLKDSQSSGDTTGTAIAETILSSAKCRVLISKSVLTGIKEAHFAGTSGQDYDIPLFDYGDSFCLEIPLIVLFNADMYRLENIIVIRGAK